MAKRSLWRPYTDFQLGETAIITWGRSEAVLTCEQPGKTGGVVPQRPKFDLMGSQGDDTPRTRITDGAVEWSYTVTRKPIYR